MAPISPQDDAVVSTYDNAREVYLVQLVRLARLVSTLIIVVCISSCIRFFRSRPCLPERWSITFTPILSGLLPLNDVLRDQDMPDSL